MKFTKETVLSNQVVEKRLRSELELSYPLINFNRMRSSILDSFLAFSFAFSSRSSEKKRQRSIRLSYQILGGYQSIRETGNKKFLELPSSFSKLQFLKKLKWSILGNPLFHLE